MVENIKIGLLLGALVSFFFWLAPHIPSIWAVLDKPRNLVSYSTAVQGRITGSEVSRQYHLYYLNGTTDQLYDFNGFVQSLTPAQQQLAEDAQHTLGLGQQLQTGDLVAKAAGSTVLTVQRGDSSSRWFCSTPHELNQAQ
jgi:hypothetical protein